MNRNSLKELQRILRRSRIEKLTEPVHTKLPFSISSWLQKNVGKGHVSEFVRESIIERLERMIAGDE